MLPPANGRSAEATRDASSDTLTSIGGPSAWSVYGVSGGALPLPLPLMLPALLLPASVLEPPPPQAPSIEAMAATVRAETANEHSPPSERIIGRCIGTTGAVRAGGAARIRG